MSGEKVRPDCVAAVPDPSEAVGIDGVRVAPVEHLLQMKLTSFRPKDMAHVQDMLAVGLVTPEIEHRLPPVLRDRLEEVKRLER